MKGKQYTQNHAKRNHAKKGEGGKRFFSFLLLFFSFSFCMVWLTIFFTTILSK